MAMAVPASHTTVRPAALIFIFITVMLDMLALGMIVPVLAPLVATFLGGDTARAASVYGLFGTVWALMQFVASPVLGAFSDDEPYGLLVFDANQRIGEQSAKRREVSVV